jgi:CheY-like chemotaxis protein
MHVLVVDDDPLQRAIVRRALDAQGWTVDEAGAAEAALDLARKTRYDAIVLDFVLPDADGLAAMDALHHWGIDAPVIVLSGSESAEVTMAMLRAGAVDFLRKDALSPLRVVHSIKHARRVFDARARLTRGGGPRAAGGGAPDAAAATDPPPTAQPPTAPFSGARALLVDDTDVSRRVVKLILEPRGWVVDEASTAEAAVAAAKRERPDVIVLDYLLPDASGLDVLARLRDAGVRAPVVALTGHGSERVAEAFLRAGAVDYLGKEDLPAHRLLVTLRNAVWAGAAP